MLTKLAKALGLKQPNGSDAEQDILILALKGKCAGDSYYHDMSQSVFDSAMEGNEEDDFYHFYARQRAIGMQAFKKEVENDLSALSGCQLHAIVQHHNYDSGIWLLTQIIAHPNCEFATALCIYWANQPGDHYARYETLDLACKDVNALSHAHAVLLSKIECKTKLGTFAQTLPVPDVACFLDRKPDYSVKPLINIPIELRVHL
ncbi:DUF4274 domain-containing protein [Janthinobacterium sp. BJB1]|uniref:DUF4274 domain-containing protein n=1 Tax=Janthinobacterium sp. GW458P TaxID=1981504 RepID=UPI000A31FECE|nr:DUF4274 domain-containing protein [Janthinobacterium sp. GW458P]MBE3026924.1 DUF4274 domain-containing protein [Janthinobacterium sp. GW458P]PHV15981.1 DUF4274 domain-containing protein [Janthinobacterium sp. BJB303]PJC96240.1 DUF4274 domain-containing protein [Janthinobacterium sp. BJB1]